MEVVFVKEESVDPKEDVEEEQYIEISPHSMIKNDPTELKSKALTKREIGGLLELILQNPVITSKETNATNNQQKILAWTQVTDEFNANYGVMPRTPRQLRLKWENLKKAARRRNSQIRSNKNKADAELVPKDEVLERIYSLIRRNRRTITQPPVDNTQKDDDDSDSSDDIPLSSEARSSPSGRASVPLLKALDKVVMKVAGQAEPETNGTCHHTTNGQLLNPLRKKKRSDEGREARNRAIADYYTAKTRLTEANLTNILLQNEKLQLEIDLLKKKKK